MVAMTAGGITLLGRLFYVYVIQAIVVVVLHVLCVLADNQYVVAKKRSLRHIKPLNNRHGLLYFGICIY